jgi:FkbM family methyltransferase
MRDSLNRAAPQGLTSIEVAAGDLAGFTLSLNLHEEKDYWLGTYELELQKAIAELVQPGWVAYDVGANIGYISLLLSRRVGEAGRVFAFEALPANLDRLRHNLALNHLEGRVQVVAAAVTDHNGPVEFLIGPSGGMGKAAGSAGRQVEYERAIPVSGISLDEFVYDDGSPPPQVIKMDIEGGEVMALPGMRRLLREAHPLLLLELHGPEAAQVAWRELSDTGYCLCGMAPGYPPIPSLEALDWKAYLIAK